MIGLTVVFGFLKDLENTPTKGMVCSKLILIQKTKNIDLY